MPQLMCQREHLVQRAIEIAHHAAFFDAGDAIAESTAALAGALLSVNPIFSESCMSEIG